MDSSLKHRLSRVGRRFKTLHLGWSLAALWLVFAAIGILLVLARKQGAFAAAQVPWYWLIAIGLSACVLAVFLMLRPTNLKRIARRIEARFPNLNEELLTATDVRPNTNGEYGFLQRSVVATAIRHDVRFSWARIVSTGQVLLAWMSNVPALGALLLVALALWQPAASPKVAAPENLAVTPRLTEVEVQPGDTEIENETQVSS